MSDYNDSFEEPMTRNEMLACGRNIGATHAIFSYESNETYVSYVMPGECADGKLERIEGGCAFNEMVDLTEEVPLHLE